MPSPGGLRPREVGLKPKALRHFREADKAHPHIRLRKEAQRGQQVQVV